MGFPERGTNTKRERERGDGESEQIQDVKQNHIYKNSYNNDYIT